LRQYLEDVGHGRGKGLVGKGRLMARDAADRLWR
jgi:hypothetical protein